MRNEPLNGQMDWCDDETENRIRAFVAEHFESVPVKAAVLQVLVPCPCCGRALTQSQAAYDKRLTRQRISAAVRKVQMALDLPTAYGT